MVFIMQSTNHDGDARERDAINSPTNILIFFQRWKCGAEKNAMGGRSIKFY